MALRSVTDDTPGARLTRASRADGTFEITEVPPGQYMVGVYRFGNNVREFASFPLHVLDVVEDLPIWLRRGLTVQGQVLFEGTPPESLAPLQVSAVAAPSAGANAVGVQPNADGTFTLEHLFGPTLIRAGGLRGWHLTSVLFGGREITDEPVEFDSAAPGERLQVVLTQHASSVAGTVTSARGTPLEAAVVLFSEDPARWHDRFTTTRGAQADADGRFRIEGLQPGRYLAAAIAAEDATTLLSSATAALFEMVAKQATPVFVGNGEPRTVALRAITLRP